MGQETPQTPQKTDFENHRDFLKKCIDPDFGLLDKLLRNDALSYEEITYVKEEKTSYDRTSKLLDFIAKKDKYDGLVAALQDMNQSHIVNYLKGNGVYNKEFQGEWPLMETEISILKYNQGELTDILEMDDILYLLYGAGVINKRQRDFISSKGASYQKNETFLDILRRCSLSGYSQTINCLHQSGQSHIAKIFDHGGVLVSVDASVEVAEGNSSEAEKEFVARFKSLSPEERNRVLEVLLLRFPLVAAKLSQSVALYFHCVCLEEVDRLLEAVKSRKLEKIIETVFNRLVTTKVRIRLKHDSCIQARNYFKDTQGGDADEKLYTPTEVNKLPLELLSIILRKTYIHSRFEENSLRHHSDKDVISILASVEYSWLQEMINRRIKHVIWRQLSVIYRRVGKVASIIKINRTFLEESIHLKILTKEMRSIDCLTDAQALSLRRRNIRIVRHRRLRRENKTISDLFHYVRLSNEIKRAEFGRCLLKTGQYDASQIVESGGAVVKVQTNRSSDDAEVDEQIVERLDVLCKNSGDRLTPGSAKVICHLEPLGEETHQREAYVWMWCDSKDTLHYVMKLYKTNGLAHLYAGLVKSAASKTASREETQPNFKLNIDLDQFLKKIDWEALFAEDVPLTDREQSILDINYESLIETLETTDLKVRLLCYGVISKRKLDFISSMPTSYDKNEALLDILKRQSLGHYQRTIQCLRDSKQKHIADLFEHGGVLMTIYSEHPEKSADVYSTENYLITKLTTILEAGGLQELSRKLQDVGLCVVAVKRSLKGILLYVYCAYLKDLRHLKDLQQSGGLEAIIKWLFTELLSPTQYDAGGTIDEFIVTLSEDQCNKCISYDYFPSTRVRAVRDFNQNETREDGDNTKQSVDKNRHLDSDAGESKDSQQQGTDSKETEISVKESDTSGDGESKDSQQQGTDSKETEMNVKESDLGSDAIESKNGKQEIDSNTEESNEKSLDPDSESDTEHRDQEGDNDSSAEESNDKSLNSRIRYWNWKDYRRSWMKWVEDDIQRSVRDFKSALCFKKGDEMKIISALDVGADCERWMVKHVESGEIGYIPRDYVVIDHEANPPPKIRMECNKMLNDDIGRKPVLTAATINEVPLELMDIILLKSCLYWTKAEGQSLRFNKSEHIISQLASVNSYWFRRMTKSHFKNLELRHFSGDVLYRI